MTQKNFLIPLQSDPGSLDAVLIVLEQCIKELRAGRVENWENPTLEQFLEAMHAWLQSVGPHVEDRPSWKLLEYMLNAGKLYE